MGFLFPYPIAQTLTLERIEGRTKMEWNKKEDCPPKKKDTTPLYLPQILDLFEVYQNRAVLKERIIYRIPLPGRLREQPHESE